MQMNMFQSSIDSSLQNANDIWKQEADAAVRLLIRQGSDFSVDDVIALLEEKNVGTHNYSALGGIMQKFSKEGYLQFIHYKTSQRKSRHHAVIRVWRPMKRLARVS